MSEFQTRPIVPADKAALLSFFTRVPEGDRTFFREDVLAPGVIDAWFAEPAEPAEPSELAEPAEHRHVAVDGDEVVGYVAVLPEVGWSSHVGELRVVVDPTRRRRGVGRALARYGLLEGLRLDLKKLVVEVVADQDATAQMFSALGFEVEALLKDHVRAADGTLRDLVVMAHFVEDAWAAMQLVGIDDAIRN
jgi:ribosomal protein S18 acetylase RimI-like enzyme